jgi:hypothetical protein
MPPMEHPTTTTFVIRRTRINSMTSSAKSSRLNGLPGTSLSP